MDLLKERVAQWARAKDTLEQVRIENTQAISTIQGVAALRTANNQAIANSNPRNSSGLVEQQLIFQRISRQ